MSSRFEHHRAGAGDKLQLARILTQAGFTGAYLRRPDRGLRSLRALREWGPSVAGAFAAAAARAPDRLAVIDERGALTWSELDRRSNAIAGALEQRGVTSGTVVALMARNHRGFFEAAVAIAKLGAHAVFLNTAFAGPQLAAVCKREGVMLIVHDEEFQALLNGILVPRVISFHEGEAVGPHPTLADLIASGNPAPRHAPKGSGRQIILTSGTTGMPKGARRPEPKGLEPIAAFIERIPYRDGDRWMIAAPVFHAWGFVNWVFATSLAGTVVLSRRFDAEGTLAAVAEHRCNHLVVVPVMLQRILELEPEVLARHDLASMRVIALSGSALPGELALRAMDVFGDVAYNMYGSTEVAFASIATPADLRAAPGTAGRPTRWTDLRVLDDQGEPVASGQVGRIFVKSGLAFEGYTGGGDKARIDGLVSSGDLGHLDADGRLFVDGRDDDMIITGGENVFPREIEDLLADHPDIAEVAVVGVADDRWGQALTAFVVVRDGADLDRSAVQAHVRHHLAGYKVPRDVLFVRELPRNATGKILRRDLQTVTPQTAGGTHP